MKGKDALFGDVMTYRLEADRGPGITFLGQGACHMISNSDRPACTIDELALMYRLDSSLVTAQLGGRRATGYGELGANVDIVVVQM